VSAVTATVLDGMADVDPAAFDALDTTAGAAGCHARLRQHEGDRRWRVRYVRLDEAGRLVAVLPLYAARGRIWPDESYDSACWGGSPGGQPLSAEHALLVGGCADLRSGLPVAGDGDTAAAYLRHAMVTLARLAAREGRGLIFPYVYPAARRLLDAATRGQARWATLDHEAQFPAEAIDAPGAWGSSRVRGVLRHDRRLIDSMEVTGVVAPWPADADMVSSLVAEHNIRKGRADHAEFVRMRHDLWAECAGVEVIVFTGHCGSAEGALTALVWRDQLELYEIGLSGPEGRQRLALYLDLMFHRPLAFAGQRGLRGVRAGLSARTPKASRGATFRALSGGELGVADTARMADGS
jgi:hypothetical protein